MNRNSLLLLISLLAVVIPTLHAHIAVFDAYWQNRAKQAWNVSLSSYDPHPEDGINELNFKVDKAVRGDNSTRRHLAKYNGPCLATNPIDRCWRCDPNWEKNRKRLAKCALGFGRQTTGGLKGRIYVVTHASDNDMVNPKPGTLRHAVTRNGPLWIIFARSMIIRLNQELIMTSDKTIDGRGANVRIVGGAGITIQYVKNVIIHNIHLHNIVKGSGGMIIDSENHVGLRTPSDGDSISIFGSSNIWIDHCSLSKGQDGLIDVVEASTAITLSNNHMTHHNEVMLFGASGSSTKDKVMQITVAFNHFGKGLVQRMPRCRWGFFHVLNNDYTHWQMYAIGGSNSPTIISQGNRFIAPPNPRAKEVTQRNYAYESEWKHWLWKSEKDLMVNGAFFVTSGDPNARLPFSKKDVITARPGTYVRRLTRFAGTLNCKVGQPC